MLSPMVWWVSKHLSVFCFDIHLFIIFPFYFWSYYICFDGDISSDSESTLILGTWEKDIAVVFCNCIVYRIEPFLSGCFSPYILSLRPWYLLYSSLSTDYGLLKMDCSRISFNNVFISMFSLFRLGILFWVRKSLNLIALRICWFCFLLSL